MLTIFVSDCWSGITRHLSVTIHLSELYLVNQHVLLYLVTAVHLHLSGGQQYIWLNRQHPPSVNRLSVIIINVPSIGNLSLLVDDC